MAPRTQYGDAMSAALDTLQANLKATFDNIDAEYAAQLRDNHKLENLEVARIPQIRRSVL